MTVARIWPTHVCVRNDAHQASDGAETEIPIVHLLPIRGSYMSGFAYACRRPKPFDLSDVQLEIGFAEKLPPAIREND